MANEIVYKGKIHYAWVIFVGCIMVNIGSLALTSNIQSVFILQAAAGVSSNVGDWSLGMTMGSVAGIIMTPLWSHLIQKSWRWFRVVSTIAAILIVFRMCVFGFATELWQQRWLGGVVGGLGGPVLMLLTIPALMGNWFAPKSRGKYLAIAVTFSGLGTFVFAPVFAIIVNAVGFRMGYFIDAALIALILLPFTLKLFRFKPSDMGLQPYGYVEGEKVEDIKAVTGNKANEVGVKVSTALKSPTFWLIFFGAILVAACAGFNRIQSGFASSALSGLYDAETISIIAATTVSLTAVSNMLWKLAYGFLHDKLGARLSVTIIIVVVACAFPLWFISPNGVGFFYVGAFCLGGYSALTSAAFPLIARNAYGGKNFAKLWGYTCMFNSVVSNGLVTIIGWVQVGTGSYLSATWLGLGILAVVLVCTLASFVTAKSLKWDDDGMTLEKDSAKA